MNSVEILRKKDITFKEKLISISFISVVLLMYFIFIGLNFKVFDNLISIVAISITPIIVLIIHELIHIALFKLFGKHNAKIKVIYDKDIGAVAIYQSNKNVKYSLKELTIILLTPMISLTLIGVFLLNIIDNAVILELVKINILLNILGSHLDFTLTVLAMKKFNNLTKFSFDYEYKEGLVLIAEKNTKK